MSGSSSVPSIASAYQLDSSADLGPSGMELLVAAYQVTIISGKPVFNAQQELTLMERPAPHRRTQPIAVLPTRFT